MAFTSGFGLPWSLFFSLFGRRFQWHAYYVRMTWPFFQYALEKET